jgi:hypothetical protein
MRKLMMLVAMLALVVVAAAPAIAQVTQGFSEKSTKSGGASPAVKASNSGKNFNFCPTDLQHVNTGNTLDEQGEVQNKSTSDGPGFGGTDLGIVPTETGTCDQTMRQAAAAK